MISVVALLEIKVSMFTRSNSNLKAVLGLPTRLLVRFLLKLKMIQKSSVVTRTLNSHVHWVIYIRQLCNSFGLRLLKATLIHVPPNPILFWTSTYLCVVCPQLRRWVKSFTRKQIISAKLLNPVTILCHHQANFYYLFIYGKKAILYNLCLTASAPDG